MQTKQDSVPEHNLLTRPVAPHSHRSKPVNSVKRLAHIRTRVCFWLPTTCKLDFPLPTVCVVILYGVYGVRNLRSNRRVVVVAPPEACLAGCCYCYTEPTRNNELLSNFTANLIYFFNALSFCLLWGSQQQQHRKTLDGYSPRRGWSVFVRLLIRTPVECLIGNLVVGQIVIIHERLVEQTWLNWSAQPVCLGSKVSQFGERERWCTPLCSPWF